MSGIEKYGLPQRIRSDHGRENIKVWRYILQAYHGDTSRVITGSSTHNERIERLWRDVHRSVTINYAEIFYSLEAEGILDALNEVDLYCLHHVYLPYHTFAKASQTFRNHGMTTSFRRKGVRLPTNCSLMGLPINLGLTQNSHVLVQHASCLIYNLMTQLVSPVTHSNHAHYCSHCCYQWTHWHPVSIMEKNCIVEQ